MSKSSVIIIADLFCGAGGTTSGAVEAAHRMGRIPKVTAINHWDIAVKTHAANHPDARHLCASLDSLNPRDYFKEGELDVLLASPECMSHSNARGGRPVNDQSRATAWCVLRWADALRPPAILIENVPEFEHWAPIGSNGRPLPSRRGEVFQSWCDALRSLGYRVEHRVLCAADYGDPTTRRRLFIQAVRGRRKCVWPWPTHAESIDPGLFGQQAKRWVAARRVIDWDLKGKSIYDRKKPLAEKTLRRIYAGLERFGLRPFVLRTDFHQGNGSYVYDPERSPITTLTTVQGHAIAEPYLVELRGTDDRKIAASPKSLNDPAPTITASGAHLGLVDPYLVQVAHGNGSDLNGDDRRAKPIDGPLPTVCGSRGEWAVCEPFIVPNFGEREGQQPRMHAVDGPLPTVTGHGAGGLVQPFILPQNTGNNPRSVDAPVPTLTTTSRGIALIEPSLLPQQSGGALRPISEPVPTVATSGAIGLLQPVLIKFYGTAEGSSIDKPLDTVTTKDRFGLARPVIELQGKRYVLDILFRMLQPHELSAAQGFPAGYKFSGTKTEVVKQIGNAVPRRLARSLFAAMVTQDPDVAWLADAEEEAA